MLVRREGAIHHEFPTHLLLFRFTHIQEVKKNLRPAMGDIEAAIKLMNQSVKRACDALKQHEVQVVEDLQLTDVHTPANVAQQAAVRDARLSDAVVGKEKRTGMAPCTKGRNMNIPVIALDSESEDEEVDYGYGSD